MFERLLVVCYQSSVGLSQFSVLLLKAVILSVIVSLHFLLLLWFSFCRWLFSYLFLSSPLCFCQRVFLVIFYSTPSLFLYSHSAFLCFYQWAVILFLWSIQQQKKRTDLRRVYCTGANNWWRVPLCVHTGPFTRTTPLLDGARCGLI